MVTALLNPSSSQALQFRVQIALPQLGLGSREFVRCCPEFTGRIYGCKFDHTAFEKLKKRLAGFLLVGRLVEEAAICASPPRVHSLQKKCTGSSCDSPAKASAGCGGQLP